jgi:hypothetical protein
MEANRNRRERVPLADRVTMLEQQLQETRELIQKDMQRLIEMVKKER